MTESKKRRTGATRILTRLFLDNPGVVFTLKQLKAELKNKGITPLTDESVRGSLSYMRATFEAGTGVVNPEPVKVGQSWVHEPDNKNEKVEAPSRSEPKSKAKPRMWEEIGMAKDGETFILRAPDGKLYNTYEI